MCGITGYGGKGSEAVLNRMNTTLAHRGPDDAGLRVFQSKKEGGTVGLAQRRLSIVDLSPSGHQPMSNEEGAVWVAFNGEIYNHLALREQLTQHHTFRGTSDTEVIVHLYEELGQEVFSRLEGMFAIALFDTNTDTLYLARDRMGKKPLYWSVQDKTLLFGSEMKALMEHPAFKKEIDPVSLDQYFFYEYVPTPRTIFAHTYKLEPGMVLVWRDAVVRTEQFWKPHFLPKHTESVSQACDSLESVLRNATQTRLVADVPVGIFLSGGIDSSAIAYYAVEGSVKKVQTFSIGFEEASFDESSYARMVAEHLDTEHHEEILSAKDCIKLIPEIGAMLDEPMADASIVPTYLLSRFTRTHVAVALGGDGGDELFCGYDTFLAQRLASYYEYVPSRVRAGIASLVRHLPTSHTNMSLDFKLRKFTEGFEGPSAYRNQQWLSAFSATDREALFLPRVWSATQSVSIFSPIEHCIREMDSHEGFDELAYLYQRMYMMDQVLVKVDRASMMHALEVRAPFLDTTVVDFANRLPTSHKLHGTTRKYILKKLMEGKLPREIIYRKKKGFGMPVGAWMRDELRPLLEDLLSPASLSPIGLFNEDYIARLVREHAEGLCDHRKKLWSLVVFVLWWKRWMG